MIFDLTIPGGMGGAKTIKKIRQSYPNIPIFVAIGYGKDLIMAKPKKYGFTASISKPFTIIEISDLLNKYIDKKQQK